MLGFNIDTKATIGALGCLITSHGNMLMAATGDAGYTPAFMNEWLRQNGGFVKDTGIVYWSKLLELGFFNAAGQQTTKVAINVWLRDQPNYADIEVRNAAGGQHFVLGIAEGQIIDSADGKQKSIDTYPIVNAHLYRFSGGKGSVIVPDVVPVPAAHTTNDGDEQMIADTDNEFGRWGKVFKQIRGRDASRDEFRSAAVGQTWLRALEILSDSPEADQATSDQALGMIARTQDWDGQITHLRADNSVLESQVATLSVPPVPTPLAAPETPTVAITPTFTGSVGDFVKSVNQPVPSTVPVKQMDAITAAEKLHSVSAQGYGLLQWVKRHIHNFVFAKKI